jgi:hypothetical protein
MTSAEIVARAEQALRTGQPGLAVLYMRRGLSESAAGRDWLAWHDFRAEVLEAAADVGLVLDVPVIRRRPVALLGWIE